MSAIVAAFRDTVQSICALLDPANPAHKLFNMNSLSLAQRRTPMLLPSDIRQRFETAESQNRLRVEKAVGLYTAT
jgi:hypothetical protein